MSKQTQANLLLLLAAFVWGFAFVAQRQGMLHLGPFTFNGIRFVLGTLSLLPLLVIFKPTKSQNLTSYRLFIDGTLAGLALFVAASLQQSGMVYTTAGNAGFITSLYIVFVPLIGLLFSQGSNSRIWISVGIAMIGFYLLSVGKEVKIQQGDLLVFISAIFWAIHLIILSMVAPRHDFRKLAIIQYSFVALASLVVAIMVENPNVYAVKQAAIPLLYAGIVSVGIGFTLQLLAQRYARADHAALILSLEAVFAALGGWIILNETTSFRGMAGCVLILLGVAYSQIKKRDFTA